MDSSNFKASTPVLEKYLKAILKIFEDKLGFLPASVISFGSAAKGGFNHKISDADFLIVLDDGVGGAARRAVFSYMLTLQEYFFKARGSSLLDRLLYFFETGTGMFKSFFICFERDLLSASFHRVFNVNRFLSWLTVPGKLILNSVFSSCRVVYGKKYDFKIFKRGLNSLQIFKSFMLCSLLYLFFILINCFKPAFKYFYGSIKWSLLNCYFYLTGGSVKVKEAALFFKKLLECEALDRFLFYQGRGFKSNLKEYFNFYRLIFSLHFKAPKLLAGRKLQLV
ncbi:MAG: nucleotidyltransferase domain-containing protein [Candidatus Odinarchaeum yellowstonii]|uniref:Nucleotidyltransferase domain-containing protein n=1 Tax=Odinarchaeota yellowstonii (strain LCB_4) TaxID=1841599 RepID=A0AAF0IBE4_ODILC|nr:MAG: nucleotidyltransferase domain-containing protein [Candidatus Odinarchaeum yellowstonii]